MIPVGDLIKEAVAISGQLVNYLLDYGLHLEESKDSPTCILVEDLAANTQELHCRDAASTAVIKEACQSSGVLQRH